MNEKKAGIKEKNVEIFRTIYYHYYRRCEFEDEIGLSDRGRGVESLIMLIMLMGENPSGKVPCDVIYYDTVIFEKMDVSLCYRNN